MNAAQRLAALDRMPAAELCAAAETALTRLAALMNEETMLLRAGHFAAAGLLGAEKASQSQDYVAIARSVQRQAERLRREAPDALDRLRLGHERLATQMAENLRVIATARKVTDDLLTDVAVSLGRSSAPKTYGASGTLASAPPSAAARGLAINRAL